MVILAVALGALALGVAGAALALALVGGLPRRAERKDPPAEEKGAGREEKLLEGIENLLNYDPYQREEGEAL